jgi:hypothetical protein
MNHYYRIRDGRRCVEPAVCRSPQFDCEPATPQEVADNLRRLAGAIEHRGEILNAKLSGGGAFPPSA